MPKTFRERAKELEDAWDLLKKEYQEQPWLRRRVKLIQKKNRTTAEDKELAELEERESQERFYGRLEDRELDRKLVAAVEALEKAVKSQEKSDGK